MGTGRGHFSDFLVGFEVRIEWVLRSFKVLGREGCELSRVFPDVLV